MEMDLRFLLAICVSKTFHQFSKVFGREPSLSYRPWSTLCREGELVDVKAFFESTMKLGDFAGGLAIPRGQTRLGHLRPSLGENQKAATKNEKEWLVSCWGPYFEIISQALTK